MSDLFDRATSVFRDFNTVGDSLSGAYEPTKASARALMAVMTVWAEGWVSDIVNAPTGDEAEGARYIVSASPSGLFGPYADHIAIKIDDQWQFSMPPEGAQALLNRADSRLWQYSSGAWGQTTAATLGLGTAANHDEGDFALSSRTVTAGSGLSGGGTLTSDITLSADVTSVAGRTGAVTLSTSDVSGLGTAATHAASDFMQGANNLSEIEDIATARVNLTGSNAQAFFFGDGSLASLPQIFFASRYASLSAADTAAASAGGVLKIDKNFTLPAHTTLTSAAYTDGGVITLGNFNLTFSKLLSGSRKIFAVTGTGRVTLSDPNQVVQLFWYGPAGDGTTDDVGPLSYAAAHGLLVNMGSGNYAISAGFTLSYGTSLLGIPNKTKLTYLNNAVSGVTFSGNNVVSNVSLVGFGSASSSSYDYGFRSSGTSNNIILNCSFTNCRYYPIHFGDTSNTTIHGCIFSGNPGSNNATSSEPEIYLYGSFNRVTVRDCSLTANGGSANKQIAIFFSAQTGLDTWYDVTVENCYMRGYQRGGVYYDNEIGGTSFVAGKAAILNCRIFDSGNEAIKTKNCWSIQIANNYIENWESVGPEISGNLQGGILVNGSYHCIIAGNVGYNPSTNATSKNFIRVAGATGWGSYASPAPRASFTVSNNQAEGTNDYAYYVTLDTYQINFSANDAINCRNYLIAYPGASQTIDTMPNQLSIVGGSYRGLTQGAASAGSALQLNGVNNAIVSGLTIVEAGGIGIVGTGCVNLNVVNCIILNSGANTGSEGMRFSSCTGLTVANNRSSNFNSITTQTYGITWGSGNTQVILTDNDFTGNATGAVNTSGLPTDAVIHGNKAFWKATTTFNPGTIANGAAATSAGITVTGAAFGDMVRVSAPYSLQGCTATGSVDSANTVKITAANNTGASVTLASGTWTVSVQRAA